MGYDISNSEVVLSIIVPVYNVEKYLDDCLNSLTRQNISKHMYEIICVDDGSSDNSGKILDEYATIHANMKVFHKSNGGVSSARNIGLNNARGEYIWFVDADDVIARHSIPYVIEEIKQNEYPDVLYIGIKAFDDNSDKNAFQMLPIGEETVTYKGWFPTRITKASIIKDNHITFDTDIYYSEDDAFCVFVQQFVKSKVAINKVIYFYRQHEGSAMHSQITDENYYKYAKTLGTSLAYAEKYDFFSYRKDMVYRYLPNLMVFTSQQPFVKQKRYLKILRKEGLFPLPKYENSTSNKDNDSGARRIRQRSYTYSGYLLLWVYIRIEKIKAFFKKRNIKQKLKNGEKV